MSIVSLAVILRPGTRASQAAGAFTARGFEVQTIDPTTLLVLGEPSQFTTLFQLSGPALESAQGLGGDVPLAALPEDVRDGVAQLSFDTPPDFGPGNF